MEERPRVGVGVMVMKEGKVLIGKRKSDFADGEWAWPGGKLDYMESIIECAKRETREETGMEIENVRFLRLLNLKHYPPKHYVDIGMIADWKSGEPKIMEPDKVECWEWRALDDLPEPLFFAEQFYLETLKTGKHFFDY